LIAGNVGTYQHLQQGGQPSPIDRYNGARWAARAVDFLDDQGANP